MPHVEDSPAGSSHAARSNLDVSAETFLWSEASGVRVEGPFHLQYLSHSKSPFPKPSSPPQERPIQTWTGFEAR